MNWTKNYADLPQEICAEIEYAGVFYSKEYANLQEKYHAHAAYIYDDFYIWVVFLKQKICFRYAFLPVECIARVVPCVETQREFLNKAMHVLQTEFKCQWAGPTSVAALFCSAPDDSKKIPFGSHIVDLQQTTEEIWSHIHSKHRNVIRRAEKDGVSVRFGNSSEMLEQYMVLDEQTWKRSGKTSSTRREIEPLLHYMRENTVIYLAEKDGEPQAGAVFLYSSAMSYYMYGATKSAPTLGAANLLQWRAMLDMKERGIAAYSFVGCRFHEDKTSKYHSIQRFKARFGGEVKRGVMFKCIFNQRMYNLSCWLVRILRNHGKALSPDIIEQEYAKWDSQGTSTM